MRKTQIIVDRAGLIIRPTRLQDRAPEFQGARGFHEFSWAYACFIEQFKQTSHYECTQQYTNTQPLGCDVQLVSEIIWGNCPQGILYRLPLIDKMQNVRGKQIWGEIAGSLCWLTSLYV